MALKRMYISVALDWFEHVLIPELKGRSDAQRSCKLILREIKKLRCQVTVQNKKLRDMSVQSWS